MLTITREAAEAIDERAELELLMEPELSVLLFRRIGWGPDDYETWWRRTLDAQIALRPAHVVAWARRSRACAS